MRRAWSARRRRTGSGRGRGVGRGPGHVGEEMRGLHGGDDAFGFEAVEIGGEQDLGVLDAEAEIGGVGGGGLRGGPGRRRFRGDDVGVGVSVIRDSRTKAKRGAGMPDLFGGGEGIEGESVGFVADGVEA